MEQRGRELDSREELVEKRLTSRPKRTYNLHQRGNRPAHATKRQGSDQGLIDEGPQGGRA